MQEFLFESFELISLTPPKKDSNFISVRLRAHFTDRTSDASMSIDFDLDLECEPD